MSKKESEVLKPPKRLSAEAKVLWRKACDEWPIEDCVSQILLESGLSAFDRWQSAEKDLARDGCVVKDRWGVLKVHPAAGIARDAQATMKAAFASLHLDFAVLRDDPGRPPGK